MSTPAGDDLIGGARIRVDADTDPAARALGQFSRDAQGRLRDVRGRFVSAGDAARRMGDDIDGSSRRSRTALGRVSGAMRSLSAFAASAAAQIGAAGSGLAGSMQGVAVVAGASLLPALGALVPAAAGAGLALGTLKLGFAGVSDAVALAGKDTKKYNEALNKMGPEQRSFTQALVGLKDRFSDVGKRIQAVMLPGFTKLLKAAEPVVKVLGDAMVDMGAAFGKAAEGVGKLLQDSGFQDSLQKNLQLGIGFVKDMTSALGPFVRSLLDFGAASGPTLKAFSDGISGLLTKGLPGFFAGLTPGISGAAKLLDGLFSAVNNVLPAVGRLAGEMGRTLGPLFGEALQTAGKGAAGVLDTVRLALEKLRPLFVDLGFGFKTIRDVASIIGPTLKDTALAIASAFVPVGDSVKNAVGPLQQLNMWVQNNRVTVLETARQFGVAMIELTSAAIRATPVIIKAFSFMSKAVLDSLDVIVSGAAHAFGWVPGIGPKLEAANKAFDQFRDRYIGALDAAAKRASDFAATATPQLAAGKLKLNIDNWTSQIAEAKKKLATVPPSKQAALKATIADLEKKVAEARSQLATVQSKSVTITAFLQFKGQSIAAVSAGRLAAGGLVGYAGGGAVPGFPHGGTVSGPGTSTSDSVLARLSRGEFVVRAAAVRNYGVDVLRSLNAMRLPSLDASAWRVPDLGVGSMRTQAPVTVNVTNNVYLTNEGVLGSRFEVQDWLVRSLDDVSRMGRLPAGLRTS